MIAHWMAYVLAVGALVSLGALALERAMRAFGRPQRWVWAAALVLGLAVPAAARWMPRAPMPASASSIGEMGIGVASEAAAADVPARFDFAALDGPLAAGWMGLSGMAVLALLGAAAMLERRRRGWRAAEIDGVPVLLSPATGPAVVGLFRSRIVLPAWVVDADPAERALLLEHEREHLRAGDPRLLALGLAAIVLAPWNPAAWYGLRRLRLAMEIDCDARVLSRRADVRAYGALLLEVGRRASSGGRWVAAAAFSEPASFLERRIRIMTSRMHRPRARVVVPALALCATALAAMRALPAPAAPAPAAPAPVQALRPGTAAAGDTVRPVVVNAAAVARALDAQYPSGLRAAGVTGTVTVQLTVTPEGAPADVRAVESTHPAFAPAAVRALRTARFRPATHAGTPVAFTVLLPVQFQPAADAPSASSSSSTSAGAAPAWDRAPVPVNAEQVARALDAEYPPALRAAGIAATVQVRMRIGATGEVLRVTAESASHPEAGPAAERALAGMRFRPAQSNGVPVAVEIVLPIQFTPQGAVVP